MRREQLFAAFFFLAFCFLLYQFYRILSFFVGPLSYAALLALIFAPVYARVRALLRGRDGPAAGVMTSAVILVVVVPTIYLTALITSESVSLYEELHAFVRSGRLQEVLDRARSSRPGQLWLEVAPQLDALQIDLPELAVGISKTLSGFLAAQAPAAAANLLRFLVNFFFTAFAVFFFFRDGERMVRAVRDLIPMEAANKDAVLTRFSDTLSAVVLGSIVTAVAQGMLAGAAYWALGVPFALLLSGVTAFLSLVPFGTPLVWGSVAVYLALDGAYVRAALLVAWGVLVIGTADNFIRPFVIGGRTQIPTVFLFFGILGGLQAYGFIGMFLGPAVIAILVAFARIYREQYASDAAPAPGPPG